jgi:hypothetical protein
MRGAVTRIGRTGLVVIAVLAVATGAAYATGAGGSASTSVINACKLNAIGTIRLVDDPAKCNTKFETAVSWNVAGAKGETGATGPAGAAGATGATGPQGSNGDVGVAGANGLDGAAGPQGAKGDTGPAGADGAKGDPGATGPAGPTGATGAQGPKGDTGATGPQGSAGSGSGTVYGASQGLNSGTSLFPLLTVPGWGVVELSCAAGTVPSVRWRNTTNSAQTDFVESSAGGFSDAVASPGQPGPTVTATGDSPVVLTHSIANNGKVGSFHVILTSGSGYCFGYATGTTP